MAPDASNIPDLEDTSERQAALRRYHILDTEPEKDFDRITSLVAKVCGVSTALITLIDEERQWFKSCFNFDARETDLDISFCIHAVHEGEMLVVEDATKDPRFKDNPIVTGPPHIRFYAGAPLTTPEGVHIGTLCIIDYEPHPFDAAQREILDRMADVVVNQFELRSAEAQVQQLVDDNPQPMYVYAQDDEALLRANEAARDLYGHDDVSPLTVDDLRAPADEQPASEALSMHRRADGSFFPVCLREREVLFDGRPAVLAVPQSVSERHDGDTTIFFQTDLDGTTRSLSTEWTETTGFGIEDAVGESLLGFVHPLNRSSTADVFSALLSGEIDTCRHEVDFLTDDGRQAFAMHARLVRDGSGAPVGTAGTLTPILEEDEPSTVGAAHPSEDPPPPSDSAPSAERDTPREAAPASAQATRANVPSSGDEAETPADDEGPRPPSEEESSPDAPVPPTADAQAPEAEEETGENIGEVCSTYLPSFADAGPSASLNGPSEEEEETPSPDAAPTADAPAPERTLQPEPFDLAAQLRDLLDDKAQAARQENVALRRSLPDGPLPVRLDPEAVREVVDTMLDVGLSHAEALTVRMEAQGARITLAVEGAALSSPPAVLQSARRLAHEMDGDLLLDDEGEGRLTLTLPRSLPPTGNGHTSILSPEASDE